MSATAQVVLVCDRRQPDGGRCGNRAAPLTNTTVKGARTYWATRGWQVDVVGADWCPSCVRTARAGQ